MADIIWGEVIRSIDGDTYDIHVTTQKKRNRHQYGQEERIRVVGISGPGPFVLMKDPLNRHRSSTLVGVSVRCNIRTRDMNGQLICSISFDQPIRYPAEFRALHD